MANRADRRRQLRAREARESLRTLQPAVDMSKDELKRIEREIEQMQSGPAYTGMMEADAERFRRRMEAREQVRRIIERNGITTKDLDEARDAGWQEGFRRAAEPIIKCCYAGVVLALHDEFGFGANRAYRAIRAVDEKLIWALNHAELCDEVLEKTGLELRFDEPFDRVQRK